MTARPFAIYARGEGDRAEVAFLVDDDWQGRGISTILLAHLPEAAEWHGIATFTAEVLPHNHRMIEEDAPADRVLALRCSDHGDRPWLQEAAHRGDRCDMIATASADDVAVR